jgi:hypothetical protein
MHISIVYESGERGQVGDYGATAQASASAEGQAACATGIPMRRIAKKAIGSVQATFEAERQRKTGESYQ